VRVAVALGVEVAVAVSLGVGEGASVAVALGLVVGVIVAVALAVGDDVAVALGVTVGVWVSVGVADARRAMAVSSRVGETATVGVCGASISILHPASASAATTQHMPRAMFRLMLPFYNAPERA
jgi:hypothetical protein